MAKSYLNQDFERIKNDCLRKRELFTDPYFRPDSSSIARFNHPRSRIVWKRPHEIIYNPQLFVNDADPKDLNQGLILHLTFSLCFTFY